MAALYPELFVIYRVLSNACAPEAATERAFSTEASAHDNVRNCLAPDLRDNVLKVRWN